MELSSLGAVAAFDSRPQPFQQRAFDHAISTLVASDSRPQPPQQEAVDQATSTPTVSAFDALLRDACYAALAAHDSPPPLPQQQAVEEATSTPAAPGSPFLSLVQQAVEQATSTSAAPGFDALLPDAYYAAAKDMPYDPFWLGRNGLYLNLYAGLASKAKLRKLFADCILLVGDKFRVKLVGHDGVEIIAEATVPLTPHLDIIIRQTNSFPQAVSIGGAVHPQGYHWANRSPDLHVAPSPLRPGLTLWGCTGANAFCAAMAAHYDATTPSRGAEGWKSIRVFRNYQGLGDFDLGTLYEVRQAAMIWQNEMEAWAVRTGQA